MVSSAAPKYSDWFLAISVPVACSKVTSLPELVGATHPRSDRLDWLAGQLAHNSLWLVNIVVDRPRITEMQRVYAADPRVPFHKLVLNSNSSASLRSGSAFGMQAEVSYSRHKPVDEDGLEQRVIESVRELGILAESDRIVASSCVSVPLAYPIATRGSAAAVAELRAHYSAHGVHLVGRFGEWAYINSDEAVRRGRDLALALRSS